MAGNWRTTERRFVSSVDVASWWFPIWFYIGKFIENQNLEYSFWFMRNFCITQLFFLIIYFYSNWKNVTHFLSDATYKRRTKIGVTYAKLFSFVLGKGTSM